MDRSQLIYLFQMVIFHSYVCLPMIFHSYVCLPEGISPANVDMAQEFRKKVQSTMSLFLLRGLLCSGQSISVVSKASWNAPYTYTGMRCMNQNTLQKMDSECTNHERSVVFVALVNLQDEFLFDPRCIPMIVSSHSHVFWICALDGSNSNCTLW